MQKIVLKKKRLNASYKEKKTLLHMFKSCFLKIQILKLKKIFIFNSNFLLNK
jgi:hypothetical protein